MQSNKFMILHPLGFLVAGPVHLWEFYCHCCKRLVDKVDEVMEEIMTTCRKGTRCQSHIHIIHTRCLTLKELRLFKQDHQQVIQNMSHLMQQSPQVRKY